MINQASITELPTAHEKPEVKSALSARHVDEYSRANKHDKIKSYNGWLSACSWYAPYRSSRLFTTQSSAGSGRRAAGAPGELSDSMRLIMQKSALNFYSGVPQLGRWNINEGRCETTAGAPPAARRLNTCTQIH
ncbi:hypothetical protein EVAR_25363_1 [Eumeta japonica]|uniref:Uncharacterized protein n=1 Tax=Eumeta variegata TaxID=151549 RepID=A0A4C1Y0B9_EUMVA|nr:hypothetical protein EVAR_25363_1 [Eumeta japonica]